MDNLGAIAGPLLALLLVVLVGSRGAMLLSVVPGLLAAGAILYAIRQVPRPKTRERQPLRLQLRPVCAGASGASWWGGRLRAGPRCGHPAHPAGDLGEPSSGHELACAWRWGSTSATTRWQPWSACPPTGTGTLQGVGHAVITARSGTMTPSSYEGSGVRVNAVMHSSDGSGTPVNLPLGDVFGLAMPEHYSCSGGSLTFMRPDRPDLHFRRQ